MIKIIIVDDHKIFREGLAFLLSKRKDVSVIAEAENGEQFLNILEKEQPDIVLMDIDMPVLNGIKATERALLKYPMLKVIALSMKGDENNYYNMIQVGAKGFVLKEVGSDQLNIAIDKVFKGVNYFSPELMRNVIINLQKPDEEVKSRDGSTSINLTKRERETLELICNGFSTKEIAKKLAISPRTVEGHKLRVMEKLGANNTGNLIILAIKNNLVSI